MMRSLLLVPILATACSVGEYGEMGGGDDAMMGGDDRNLCVNKGTAAAPYMHTTAPTGPRSGMGCIAAGCHLEGQLGSGAGAMAFAGTVYKDTNGTTPQPGVTVRIFPGAGNTMKSIATALTDTAGNFIIRGGPYTAFPYQTDVTGCGTDAQAQGIRTMVSPIGRGDQNCSAGNTCHQASPTKTATPVYLMD